METHLADPLSLEQLAALTGVGSRQLGRLFQTHLSKGAMAFYRDLRLKYAERLLTTTALPIAEVAEATGFSAPAHFSRCFTELYGQPPTVFRREKVSGA
ncbi:MAG: helix-turn-helix domain-containing protein [Pseudomonadota bacterium]